ncbi:MAG: hypothetical protein K1X50_00265 [Candidatus Promineofilum sp.]|nr:hypothetical protein [Promineifilum sp.]
MRRSLVSIFALLGLIALPMFIARAWAEDVTANQTDAPLIVAEPPSVWLPDEIEIADLPQWTEAAPAADTCATATSLELSFGHTADGSGTVTNPFTTEATDPLLSCAYGVPTNPRGYRTAWHVLVAGDTGIITLTTEGTNYDTILAVFEGTCAALTSLSCADDTLGFQSKTSIRVIRGHTYYILVADYQSGAPATATLRFSAVMHEGGQRWRQVSNLPFGGVSRHAFASDGVDMYVIGGQTRLQGIPELSNRLLRYNAESRQWTELADMPGAGLSNTTAVRLGRRIYVPGGFNGNTSDYANTHLVYDLTTDFWDTAAPIPTALLPGGKMLAWASAVAAPDETSYYLTGGITTIPPFLPNAVILNNTYRYTPSTNQWEAFRPMATARYAHTAAWVSAANRGLCVVGGLTTGVDVSGQPIIVLLTAGECYNPATGTDWQPTGPLNFPRYNAGSAIGPDGNWYVFGGLDAQGNGVPEVEVYDPLANGWRVLSSEFSWGGRPTDPPFDWPRGAFWRDNLYVFGGNTPREQRVVSTVDRLNVGSGVTWPTHRSLVPIAPKIGSDNLLFWATYLPLNSPLSGNFVLSDQFYNAYYFEWPAFGRATIRLGNIPSDSNFNIAVYDAGKVLRGQSNPAIYGGEKTVQVTLMPGTYYVVVQRIFPKDLPNSDDFYSLGVFTP